MQKINLIILTVIVFLGALLRFPLLDSYPPSPNWDEVSLGYNSYSLLLTGRDEWGMTTPTLFRAFGDFKLPGYIYLLTPWIKSLGLNTVSIRLMSALSGVISIFLVYYLAHRLTKRSYIALLSAFIVAVSPWSFFVSRVALEANLAVMLFLLGLSLLVTKRLFWAIFFLGLSAWTYNSFRILSPLFPIVYFLLNRKNHKIYLIHYTLYTILFVPIFLQLLSPSGQARFYWTTILDSGAISHINELQQRPGGRLVYNKATYFAAVFTQNYLRHFSAFQLFIKGPTNYQFSVPSFGLFYLVALPFFYLGLVRGAKNKFLITWLLLAPIASSATRDTPHVLRSISLMPLFAIFIASGVGAFGKRLGHIVLVLFVSLSLLQAALYLQVYKGSYTRDYSWSWQYGHLEVAEFIKANYENYDQIIFTKRYGEPHEFMNFYLTPHPADYQLSPSKVWDYHASWYWVGGFAKFKYVNDWELLDYIKALDTQKKYLVISSPDNPVGSGFLKEVSFRDGEPAFFINQL
ncbi:MAG: glycosyltransferase family 39 protein [Patescibacteria group bacterium]